MLFVTHLADLHDLDVFSVGGAVVFSKDHTVGCPAGKRQKHGVAILLDKHFKKSPEKPFGSDRRRSFT